MPVNLFRGRRADILVRSKVEQFVATGYAEP